MTTIVQHLSSTGIQNTEPVDLIGVDVLTLPQRAYDFNKGDRRFYDRDQAIEHANLEALLTGVRQAIRLDGPAIEGSGIPLYLVQAIGS